MLVHLRARNAFKGTGVSVWALRGSRQLELARCCRRLIIELLSFALRISHGPLQRLFDIFLARDSMLSALYAIARPSVCHTGGSVKNG